MQIEKFISPFIESQFPQFYVEEGPIFIEFVKAYYEWMESTGNILNASRSLMDYKDIDTTLSNYLIYFKNKYINSLPENIVADKKLLIKHILDLYRSKGTEASYKLLFKMIFNEDIDTYLPSSQIFKLSDGNWVKPLYIEVSDNTYLTQLIGNKIYSSSTLSTAIVENYYVKTINNKVINVLVLSNMLSDIKYGEKIFCEAVPQITVSNAPIVFGSLSSVTIVNGGLGYTVGDILKVQNSGAGGLVRVKSTTSKNGEVTFDLLKGGTGFSVDAAVNVDGRAIAIKNVTQTNPVVVTTVENHNLKDANSIRIALVQGMDDLNVYTYAYFVKVLTSNTFSVYSDIYLTATLDGTSFNQYVSNGYVFVNTGATQQATFKIGSIVNKEIFNINLDQIRDMVQEEMDITAEGYGIHISDITGTFSSGDIIYMPPVNVLDTECTITSDGAYFANGESLSNTSLGINNIIVVNTDDTYLQLKGSGLSSITNSVLPLSLISNTSQTTLKIDHIYGINTINCYANVITSNSTVVSANVQIRTAYEHVIYANTAGVDSTNHVIMLTNANTYFSVGDKVLYAAPNTYGVYTNPASACTIPIGGNSTFSGIFPANTMYYCSFVNSSSIALSYTSGGANINITETRTAAPGEAHTLSSIEGYFIKGQTLNSIGTVCTISIASPAVITVPASSAPINGTAVVFQNNGGTLPTGITAGTTYYTKYVSSSQFQISLTVNGTSINTSGSQSGINIIYYNKASATIGTVDRLTDWAYGIGISLPTDVRKNLNSSLNILQYRQKEIGTIASLNNINPGKGYSVDPVVSIIEPLIYDLDITEPFGPYTGTIKGFNTSVSAKAGSANGIVTAIEVVDSGFGYDRDQTVELISNTNPYAVTATTVVDKSGIGKGYWKDNKSFLSDEMYIQDSYYYQKYSYEIVAPRMLNTYENYVKNLIHPTGVVLFGKYVIINELQSEQVTADFFDLSSYYTFTVDDITTTSDNNIIKSDHN